MSAPMIPRMTNRITLEWGLFVLVCVTPFTPALFIWSAS